MELELGLALPTSAPSKGLNLDLNNDACLSPTVYNEKKRHLADALGGDDTNRSNTTLPLLHWASTHDTNNNDKVLVGWPPVKSAWRNSGGAAAAAAARYVKVKMEGVAIGRKVDVSLHRSYTTLLDTLDGMFAGIYEEEGKDVGLHTVGLLPLQPGATRRHLTFTYQDSEGDWMLLGDVPWQSFVKSVRRLKILSGGE